jgi:multisubunit Na+/H+ antiporter MnhB subunit
VTSRVLRTAARLLSPMLAGLSVVIMLRGHNEPGGGFIGGLVLAMAWLLPAFVDQTTPRLNLWMDPQRLIGVGWLIALLAPVSSVLFGVTFFESVWGGAVWLPLAGKVGVGTPLFFDFGVYLTVAGVTLKMASLFMQAAMERSEYKKMGGRDR